MKKSIGSISCFPFCLQESLESERGSIYHSLVTNTSKEMMCFSDFPMPADYPNYLHNSELLQYFRLYAEHFDLLRYINFQVIPVLSCQELRCLFKGFYNITNKVINVSVCVCPHMFQTTVTRVTQRPDFSLSGQWDIVTINRDGEEERHVFDAVLVCSGHYIRPALPLSDFPGLWTKICQFLDTLQKLVEEYSESIYPNLHILARKCYFPLICSTTSISPGHATFSGRCFHSWEYKDAHAYRGKRVVVVGTGSSGGDIAVEMSRCAKKVRREKKSVIVVWQINRKRCFQPIHYLCMYWFLLFLMFFVVFF